MVKEKKIIEEYNIIRVIATVLVVIGHAGYISPWTDWGGINMGIYCVPLTQKIINLGIRLIYSFHMPLFFALSGALFYKNIKEEVFKSVKTLIKVKVKRLMIPFVLVTALWVIPLKLFSDYWSGSSNIIKDIVLGQVLLLGNSHLWFLWVLFIITIISYFFHDNNILRIIIAFAMFLVGGALDMSVLGISQILLNFIWFELGYQYGKYRNVIIEKFEKHKVLFTVGTIVLYLYGLTIYLKFAKGNEYLYGVVHLFGIVMSFAIALLLVETKCRNSLAYKYVLEHSMGIYLFSDTINYPILKIIKKYHMIGILESNIGAGLLFVFRIFITLFLAIIIDILIKKMILRGVKRGV